jgi:hypothetical protein
MFFFDIRIIFFLYIFCSFDMFFFLTIGQKFLERRLGRYNTYEY